MAKTISNEEIISALLTHGTIRETAEALEMKQRTLYDRMKDVKFKVDYADARAEILRATVASVTRRLSEAVETVAEIMSNPDVNPATRLQAAQTIISTSVKLKESLYRDDLMIREMKRPTDFFDDWIE